MMELIDAHLGYEARRWLEEYLTEDDSHTYKIMIEKEYVIGYNNLYEFYNFLQHHSEVRICSKITLS